MSRKNLIRQDPAAQALPYNPRSAVNTTRRRTFGFLLAGLLLAVGTPTYLAVVLGLETYLLHPVLLAEQALPYLLAGILWLPCRTPPATSIGQALAGVLLVAAGLVYIPMLTGLLPMGGDMVALTFGIIDVVTVLALLAITALAYCFLYIRHRHRKSAHRFKPKQPQGGSSN